MRLKSWLGGRKPIQAIQRRTRPPPAKSFEIVHHSFSSCGEEKHHCFRKSLVAFGLVVLCLVTSILLENPPVKRTPGTLPQLSSEPLPQGSGLVLPSVAWKRESGFSWDQFLKGMPFILFVRVMPIFQHSLLDIGIMCDKDYKVLFTKRRVTIYNKDGKPFLT